MINPPYFKYSAKDSKYARATSDLFRGDPNIYASFMAIVTASLSKNGQLISITPRSFTNGLYFKGFRDFLLSEASLNIIHIFKKRDRVFNTAEKNILQENIICKFVKGNAQNPVTIRASNCNADINEYEETEQPSELIIDTQNGQNMIRIPETRDYADVMHLAELLPSNFSDVGYAISTGPVVEHRTKLFITDHSEKGTVPLFRPHNITPQYTSWDGVQKKDASFKLLEGHEKHTVQNNNFVLLKRFSSKDEKRRLVASVHLKESSSQKFIGIGNKLNFITVKEGELNEVEASGLAAIFNSTFMDTYFRSISGNTQVNATEIRIYEVSFEAASQRNRSTNKRI